MDNDEIKIEGVLDEGYGIIPKKVMKDTDLSIEAKSIYAFLASYTGKGNTAFPGVEMMTDRLGISRQRFNKHRKSLEEKGYITVEQNIENNQFKNNVYKINSVPSLGFTTTEIPTSQIATSQNLTSNNNTSINNTNNNNTSREWDPSAAVKYLEELLGAGQVKPHMIEDLNFYKDKFEKPNEIVTEAVDISVVRGVRNWKYTKSIIQSWRNEGLKTISEIRKFENDKQNSKQGSTDYINDL